MKLFTKILHLFWKVIILISFISLKTVLASNSNDTIPWQIIELTGQNMKTHPYRRPIEADHRTPYFIIGGGIVLGATSGYLLLKDNEKTGDRSDQIIIRDDQVILECNQAKKVDVLQNDKGNNLVITKIEGSDSDVQIVDNQIKLLPNNQDEREYTYMVEDAIGNTASAKLIVTVIFPEIQLVDDKYSIDLGGRLIQNILENDIGINLQVTQVTSPEMGDLTWESDGTISFTTQSTSTAEIIMTYKVEDQCGQSSTARIIIEILKIPCEFVIIPDVIPTHCGLADGSITLSFEPNDNYQIEWKDGAISSMREDLSEGIYQVKVTNDKPCSDSLEIKVDMLPADYNLQSSTDDAKCYGGGEIEIISNTPGSGPMIYNIYLPNGEQQQFEAGNEELIHLSDLFNIYSGHYICTVYDNSATESCKDTINIDVGELTDTINAMVDVYQTKQGQTISGNILDNDMGIGLKVYGTKAIKGGNLSILDDGTFDFSPYNEFFGEGGFFYSMIDTCGQIDSADVFIQVEEVECELSVSVMTNPAHCGFFDGSAQITLNRSENYIFNWSDGKTGSERTNLESGIHTVEIIDKKFHCDTTIEVEIMEEEVDYIKDTEVKLPTCVVSGDILLLLESHVSIPFILEILHPGGVDKFEIFTSGWINLSDYLDIIPGQYEINVSLSGIDLTCNETILVELSEPSSPEIEINNVTPPSSPTASDGEVQIRLAITANPPYEVWVNGVFVGETSSTLFSIVNFGIGYYEIFVVNDLSCSSNTVVVELEPQGLQNLYISQHFTSYRAMSSEQRKPIGYNPFRGMTLTYYESKLWSSFFQIQDIPESQSRDGDSSSLNISAGIQHHWHFGKLFNNNRIGSQLKFDNLSHAQLYPIAEVEIGIQVHERMQLLCIFKNQYQNNNPFTFSMNIHSRIRLNP